MILAADIGGTKTYVGLFNWTQERTEPVREEKYWNSDFNSFEDILTEFLSEEGESGDKEDDFSSNPSSESSEESSGPSSPSLQIDAACFGVAGPVVNNRCQTTNLPWIIDGHTLKEHLETSVVHLLNDLEATAYGVLVLRPNETEQLNGKVESTSKKTKTLIAAGTGLGEAILFWDGKQYHPSPSEGGHASFAPTSDVEIELLRYLRATYLHVSFERLLSGEGLHHIYQFFRDTRKNEPTWFAEQLTTGDPAALITEAGLKGKPEICVQALDLFVSILGGEAGNLALKTFSLGGVFIGGGIAPKILPKLRSDTFLRAFVAKGRYKRLLSAIPVHVILNEKAALLGTASYGASLVHQP